MHKFTAQEKDWLVVLYNEQDTTLDNLPYTWEFQELFQGFHDWQHESVKWTGYVSYASKSEVWRALCGLRKAKRLKRKVKRGQP